MPLCAMWSYHQALQLAVHRMEDAIADAVFFYNFHLTVGGTYGII